MNFSIQRRIFLCDGWRTERQWRIFCDGAWVDTALTKKRAEERVRSLKVAQKCA